jgi:RNA polymerase sigma factor (sigma-70 family)
MAVDESPDDAKLVAAYRAGDEEAAYVLHRRYYVRLIELIRRQMGWRAKEMDSSADVAQSAMQCFFAQLKKDVEISSHGDLWPLLVTITLNKVRNRAKYWQRQRRDPLRRVPLSDRIDPLERGASPEDAAVMHELLDQLLAPFSGRRRQIVRLILEGVPVHEIAERMGTTERTIYNTRKAAAKILRRVLSDGPGA